MLTGQILLHVQQRAERLDDLLSVTGGSILRALRSVLRCEPSRLIGAAEPH